MDSTLIHDPLLRDVPQLEGYKVLSPCVVLSPVGQGGMGTVYRGHHLNLDVAVAIKCLKRSLADDPGIVERFQREARLAAKIRSDYLLQIYDVEQNHGVHYLVMEFVAGESARERVQRKGKLSESEALGILLGAARGLAEAHRRGFVHRDVKPDNILISAEGEVKLADLGLAKAIDCGGAGMTMTGVIMGTPGYMSPEQWNDASRAGPATDVWSLGATAYFLLTGSDPFSRGDSWVSLMRRITSEPFPCIREVLPDVSPDIVELIELCTSQALEERLADGGLLVAAIESVLLTRQEAQQPKELVGEDADLHRASTITARAPIEDADLTRIRTALTKGVQPSPAPVVEGPSPIDATIAQGSAGVDASTSSGGAQTIHQGPRPEPTIVGSVGRPQRSRSALWAAVVACFLILGLAGTVVFSRPGPSRQQQEDWVVGGQSALANGNLLEAEQAFRRAYDLAPSEASKSQLVDVWKRLMHSAERERRSLDVLHWAGQVARFDRQATTQAALTAEIQVAAELKEALELEVPESGWDRVSRSSTVVRGSIDDPRVESICLNGQVMELDGGRFEVHHDFEQPGAQDLWLSAQLRIGSLGVVSQQIRFHTLRIHADWTPPDVSIDDAELVTRLPFRVTGRVTDLQPESCVLSVQLLEPNSDVVAWGPRSVSCDADGSWATPKIELANGRYRVDVLATDKVGLEGPDQSELRIDCPAPSVRFAAVETPEDTPGVLTVTGSVAAEGTQLFDGTKGIDIEADGAFALPVAWDGEAHRPVELEAQDALGNRWRESVDVWRSLFAEAPRVDGSNVVSSRTVRIVGQVIDGVELSVRCADGPISPAAIDAKGRFAVEVTLPEDDGVHAIELQASPPPRCLALSDRERVEVELLTTAPAITVAAVDGVREGEDRYVVERPSVTISLGALETRESLVVTCRSQPVSLDGVDLTAPTIELVLEEGENPVVLVVAGPSGLESRRTLLIRHVPPAVVPTLSLDRQGETIWSANGQVALRATVSPSDSGLVLKSGRQVDVNDSGVAEWTEELSDGRHRIEIWAERSGVRSLEAGWLVVMVDRTKPVIAITSHASGDDVGAQSTVTLRGLVTEPHLRAVHVAGRVAAVGANGHWHCVGVPVPPGRNGIRVVAEDLAGNRSEESVVLHRTAVHLPSWARKGSGDATAVIGQRVLYRNVVDRQTNLTMCLVSVGATAIYLSQSEVPASVYEGRIDGGREAAATGMTFTEALEWAVREGLKFPSPDEWRMAYRQRGTAGIRGLDNSVHEFVYRRGARATYMVGVRQIREESLERSQSRPFIGLRLVRREL